MKTKFAQTLLLLVLMVPGWALASNDHGTGAPQANQASQNLAFETTWWQWLLQVWPW
ncbi:MAG: hypothetical protein MI750_14000 [Xanthomonadales bacterium]|nr:hypothetical protein [Xanthomonadales bacterium]